MKETENIKDESLLRNLSIFHKLPIRFFLYLSQIVFLFKIPAGEKSLEFQECRETSDSRMSIEEQVGKFFIPTQ